MMLSEMTARECARGAGLDAVLRQIELFVSPNSKVYVTIYSALRSSDDRASALMWAAEQVRQVAEYERVRAAQQRASVREHSEA